MSKLDPAAVRLGEDLVVALCTSPALSVEARIRIAVSILL